jgi:hypothetical protein
MLLQCPKCNEVVAVLGSSTEYPEEGNDGVEYHDYLEPKYMWPAPPIINLDKRVPETVKAEIKLAFHLFWVDYGVCASRLRTSLERLTDHFGIAKTRIQRRNPNGPGKRVPLELAPRIDKLPSKIGTRDYSEILHALRTVGNLGTHGKKLPRDAILDAFKLYEMALDRLFEDESETAKAIIKHLKIHK